MTIKLFTLVASQHPLCCQIYTIYIVWHSGSISLVYLITFHFKTLGFSTIILSIRLHCDFSDSNEKNDQLISTNQRRCGSCEAHFILGKSERGESSYCVNISKDTGIVQQWTCMTIAWTNFLHILFYLFVFLTCPINNWLKFCSKNNCLLKRNYTRRFCDQTNQSDIWSLHIWERQIRCICH